MKTLTTAIISTTLILSASVANASIESNQYSLKGEPIAGSRISTIEAVSNVPFNKPYEKLSKKHQGLVNAKFNNLGLNDVPPFPSNGLRSVYKVVLAANKNFSDNQTIKVLLNISSTGQVDKVVVENSNNQAMNDYLERSLSRINFKSASCDGQACDMQFPIEISFN